MRAKVIVSLSPSGHLQLELPGSSGTRPVVLRSHEIQVIKRVLQDLENGKWLIATEAAPVQSQVDEWIKRYKGGGGKTTSRLDLTRLLLEFEDEPEGRDSGDGEVP